MKSIIISSNSSGGGKTTVTLGLMKALIKRGYKVQGYKVGPDYIDPVFHSYVTGNPSRNLDLFLMGENGVKASYNRGLGDLGIIEGVMGLYDGKGIDTKYSTAHISKVLKLPIILVLTPKAQSATLCAELMGILNYEDVDIVGVIFNKVSEGYYKLLKTLVEKNCDLQVFGYIPKEKKLEIKSRHLGLIQSSEIEDLEEKIDICSELILKYVDVENLIKYFRKTEEYKDEFYLENKNLNIGVAYDKAFSFYYKENLELLSNLGSIKYFSPVEDKKLPENLDFLYIGGGYPEVFIKELSHNKSMLNNIKENLNNGLKCYAECGGLMYLTEGIEDFQGNFYKTVGFFKGKSYMTQKLQNFGYAKLEVENTNSMLSKKIKINCHEFHKSYVELNDNNIYSVTKDMYNGKTKKWNCGYIKNNTLAAYPHIHFFGNINFLKQLIK
ncbi:cobyrinate a,c-diamide synthase [Clostridium niameyense]|uniref:Cobyrinate a,c-diamide synthase n=1 Tax=Clostridium niameyense TaxID=1622073 RepID=A0A6M0R9P7_9CLOT|nr:cobyrinate a,c-diamide synthase [Clostridium niameyense]